MKKLMSMILEASLVIGAGRLGVVAASALPDDTKQTSTDKAVKPSKIATPNKRDWGGKAIPLNGNVNAVTAPHDSANGSGGGAGSIGNNKVNKTGKNSPSNKHDWGNGNSVLAPTNKVDVGTPASGNATGKRNPGGGDKSTGDTHPQKASGGGGGAGKANLNVFNVGNKNGGKKVSKVSTRDPAKRPESPK